ncbi:MAG TPA: helix-turn-helix domain-containing protein [Polyangiaceae bacterium]|nr:helix-turn-helix domain-containing protein [Polyangiaceae bacterium]
MKRDAELPALLTPGEVATWLKTSVKAVYARAERGNLPGATRLGRRLYFVRSELLTWLEQGRVPHLGGPSGST